MNNRFRGLLAAFVCLPLVGASAQKLEVTSGEKGLYGYADESGATVIPCIYTEANPFVDGVAHVVRKKKHGFIDAQGNALGEMKYTLALPFQDGLSRVVEGGSFKDGLLKGGKWGFVNRQGEEVLPPRYDEITAFTHGGAVIVDGNKYGLINEQAQVILPAEYDAVGTFDRFGLCWFANGKIDKESGQVINGEYGVIRSDGKILLQPHYAYLGYFYGIGGEDSTSVQYSNSEMAAYSNSYSLAAPMSPLCEPENVVKLLLHLSETKEGKDSVMAEASQWKFYTEPRYLVFGNRTRGMGMIDTEGKVCIPEGKYSLVERPTSGMAKVWNYDKNEVRSTGYVRLSTGDFTAYDRRYTISPFDGGLGRVEDPALHQVHFVDSLGHQVGETYASASVFAEGACVVQRTADGKWGAIGTDGQILLPFDYDLVGAAFSEGLLNVCRGVRWGAVDRRGQTVIPFQYKELSAALDGYFTAQNPDGKVGVIDTTGRVVVPFEWEAIRQSALSAVPFVWVKQQGLYHCYDVKNHRLSFAQGFTDVSDFNADGIATVLLDGRFGLVDTQGREVVPVVLPNWDELSLAIQYMGMTGKDRLDAMDLNRLRLYRDASVNSFTLYDVIPSEKWDY